MVDVYRQSVVFVLQRLKMLSIKLPNKERERKKTCPTIPPLTTLSCIITVCMSCDTFNACGIKALRANTNLMAHSESYLRFGQHR